MVAAMATVAEGPAPAMVQMVAAAAVRGLAEAEAHVTILASRAGSVEFIQRPFSSRPLTRIITTCSLNYIGITSVTIRVLAIRVIMG